MVKYNNNKKFNYKEKNKKYKKVTNEDIMEQLNYKFSRDAEWFKRTVEKLNEAKDDLDKNFYSEQKKSEKLDFVRRLKNKLKDYKDSVKYAEKYKKVRFFERRKLERALTKINKEIQQLTQTSTTDENISEDRVKQLETQKEKIIGDINYVKVTLL